MEIVPIVQGHKLA